MFAFAFVRLLRLLALLLKVQHHRIRKRFVNEYTYIKRGPFVGIFLVFVKTETACFRFSSDFNGPTSNFSPVLFLYFLYSIA